MSRAVDARRREDAHAAAVERGKAQLRTLQAVLAHFVEGLSARASAERLGVHTNTVKRQRAWLGLRRWRHAVVSVRLKVGDSNHVCEHT